MGYKYFHRFRFNPAYRFNRCRLNPQGFLILPPILLVLLGYAIILHIVNLQQKQHIALIETFDALILSTAINHNRPSFFNRHKIKTYETIPAAQIFPSLTIQCPTQKPGHCYPYLPLATIKPAPTKR